MERTKVTSTAIASLGHDGTGLEVEYTSGAVHHFPDVPQEVLPKLLAADADPTDSVGRQFNELVRKQPHGKNSRRVYAVPQPAESHVF